jgi:hypothetical protein
MISHIVSQHIFTITKSQTYLFKIAVVENAALSSEASVNNVASTSSQQGQKRSLELEPSSSPRRVQMRALAPQQAPTELPQPVTNARKALHLPSSSDSEPESDGNLGCSEEPIISSDGKHLFYAFYFQDLLLFT